MPEMNVVDLQLDIITSTPPSFVGVEPVVLRLITAYTGGTATDLDAVPTINLEPDTGIPFLIRIDGGFVAVYFETGAADGSDPGQIQPLDNPDFHWTRGL